jgi:hypothetical protein
VIAEKLVERCVSGLRFLDGQDLVGGHVWEGLHSAAGPGDSDLFDDGVGAKAEVNPRIARAGVAHGCGRFIPLRETVWSGYPDLRAKAHSVAARADEVNENPMLARGADVTKELDWLLKAADDDVDTTSVEDITERRAAMCTGDLKRSAGTGTDVLEFAAAKIAKDAIWFRVGLRRDSLLYVVHYVGARDEEILPAVVVEIVDAVAPAGHPIRELAKAAGDRSICENIATLIDVEREVLMFDGGVPDIGPPVVIYIAEISTHAGERVAVQRVGDARRDGDLFEFLSPNVAEQEVGHSVVRDKRIEKAIAIKVGEAHGHALADKCIDAGLMRNVGKGAVAIIAVQGVVQRRILVGMAVATQSFFECAVRVLVDFPMAVVDDEEIEKAVIVVVEPTRTDRPHLPAMRMGAGNARFYGDVGKSSVPVVVKKLITGNVGNENVGATIVVVVTNGDTHSVACSGHAGFFSDIGKRAVVVVAIEPVPVVGRGLFKRRNLGAVDAIDVEKAVVVVIEKSHTGNHGFGLIFVRGGAIARHEVEAGLMSYFFEANSRSWRTCRRIGLRRKGPEAARSERRSRERSEVLKKPAPLRARDVIVCHWLVRGCYVDQPSGPLISAGLLSTVIDRRSEEGLVR